ncbi:hypothetical protein ACWPKO_11525 [Coraliomargarita sp. W4R53]
MESYIILLPISMVVAYFGPDFGFLLFRTTLVITGGKLAYVLAFGLPFSLSMLLPFLVAPAVGAKFASDSGLVSFDTALLLVGLSGFIRVGLICYRNRIFFSSLELPKKSTDELKLLIEDPKRKWLCVDAIRELKKRNEDFSGGLSILLDMSVSDSSFERMVGWGAFEAYFPNAAKEIQFNYRKPTRESLDLLNKLNERAN